MARYGGRSVIISIGGTPIAAVREQTFTHAKAEIDVTTNDDGGWRTLLPVAASRSVDVPVSGVCDDANIPLLQNLWLGNSFADVTLTYPDGSTAEATEGFYLNSLEITGSHDGEAAFSATLLSSGEVSITAAP
jgi:predicted secreted protein